ncbi:MAG: DUF2905 domain-containing protein [Anaerolineae bacterium]|jgi:hypothetical protein
MAPWNQLGKLLLIAGLGLALLGGLILLGARLLQGREIPFLGHLPGDIRIHTGRVSCFFPLATSIVLSLLLTLVLNILIRLWKR